ncbi:MAG: squalene/phytoene synthase family protein [Caldilineaceae bacterium]
MSTASISWEEQLFKRANVAAAPAMIFSHDVERAALDAAYAHCSRITRTHSRTFYMSSGLLPREMRSAARALYAFCRITDDIVDQPVSGSGTEGRLAELRDWRRRSLESNLSTATLSQDDSPVLAWTDTRARYGIPKAYAEQLIEGVGLDLTRERYDSFDELAHYCYLVASTVGLMTMHIIGYAGPQAIPFAIKLGVALQLTNILRDVGEDWANGRLYLPRDELAAFGLCEADIAAGQVTPQWRAFMRFQIDRARRLYAEAMPGIGLLGRDGQFAIAASAVLYQDILTKIEENDFDVFTRRAHTSRWEKVRRLPGIWWKARTNGYGIR